MWNSYFFYNQDFYKHYLFITRVLTAVEIEIQSRHVTSVHLSLRVFNV